MGLLNPFCYNILFFYTSLEIILYLRYVSWLIFLDFLLSHLLHWFVFSFPLTWGSCLLHVDHELITSVVKRKSYSLYTIQAKYVYIIYIIIAFNCSMLMNIMEILSFVAITLLEVIYKKALQKTIKDLAVSFNDMCTLCNVRMSITAVKIILESLIQLF